MFTGVYSQDSDLKYFKHIDISSGLSHNGVTSVFEDSKGFVWIGTYDGLNKYDGFRIKVFKNSYREKVLSSNRIRSLNEDSNGNLWIGTDSGITIYNFDKEVFKELPIYPNSLKKEPIIRKIVVNKKTKNVVCVSEREGIFVFKDDGTFVGNYKLITDEIRVLNRRVIFNINVLDDENYIISSTYGLYLFNIKTKIAKRILKNKIKSCLSVLKLDKTTLVSTGDNGEVTFINFNLNKNVYEFSLLKKTKIKQSKIVCTEVDNQGKLWLGTVNKGVVRIYDWKKDINDDANRTVFSGSTSVLRSSIIRSFKKDYCWLGTFDKGVYFFDLKKNPFKSNNIRLKSFLNIEPKNPNTFYLGTLGKRVTTYNTITEKYKYLDFDLGKNKNLNSGVVFSDSKEIIWLNVTNKGGAPTFIGKGKKGTKKVDLIKLSNKFEGSFRSFTEDQFGNIWVAYSNDVFKINVDANSYVTSVESLKKNAVFSQMKFSSYKFLYTDPMYDYIWMGDKEDGLVRIENERNKKIEDLTINTYKINRANPNSISSNFITSIVRLPNSELWIGTEGGGICKVVDSNKKPKFIPFTEENGLSNNVVKSILYDNESNLWISTNNGLNKFDTKSLLFRNFTKEDGLPFEDFGYSSVKLSNGMFVFSGFESFCYFNPKDINSKERLPNLEFGDFMLFNNVVKPLDTINGHVLLKTHLTNHDKIALKYNQNVFSIEVIPLHFSNPKNHHIKYKIAPLDKDWVLLKDGQNVITYNGLSPGEYTLQVTASNSLEEWTKPKSLEIIISPPFWKTNMAILIYILLGGVVIYIIFLIVLKIQTLNHSLELEQVALDNVKDNNEAKLRFFSNIAHEIKTPITLIKGPIDLLLNQLKLGKRTNIEDKLQIVQRQAKRISQLIDQVQDFQKSDNNQLRMNYEVFCFNTFLKNISIDFQFLAGKENKVLTILDTADKFYVSADRDKLEKIFNNLFSNSFKYTKEGDDITIEYKIENNNLLIAFKDTGKGISKEDLPHVFERFYQSNQMTLDYIGGAGIGLAFTKRLVEMHYGYIDVESNLGEGTIMYLKLPIISEKVYDDEPEIKEFLKEEKTHDVQDIVDEQIDYTSINIDKEFKDAKVYYAEDNVDMRNFVSELLSHFFEVKIFTNGAECLDAMKEEWPDIVVSDVLMPELNGLELCKAIKNNIKTSHIPVVLLTACISTEEQIQGINNGADAYIKKPFNIQRLITQIESLLKNRKQLRERFKRDFPLEFVKKKDTEKDDIFIDKLYSLMSENLDNKDLDMDELAKQMYLNRTHFYQKVKALTDKTPFELLKDFRLKKAAEFLVQEKLTVNEAFMSTGFKSRSHFSKVFKDKYGLTPGQYVSKGLDNMTF